MDKAILYVHGKGGCPSEAEQYRKNCPGFDLIGTDYTGPFLWTAAKGIRSAYDSARTRYDRIFLLANSIGAYFAMNALQDQAVERALLISPVLDMEQLILDLMRQAAVSEKDLRERGEIPTDAGETLSWDYLCYVREHPILWNVPTEILYAENDALIPRRTVDRFVREHSVHLTVMENGEHWFHTREQTDFLDAWMKNAIR